MFKHKGSLLVDYKVEKGGFLKSRLLLGAPKHKGLGENNVLFFFRKLKNIGFEKYLYFESSIKFGNLTLHGNETIQPKLAKM